MKKTRKIKARLLAALLLAAMVVAMPGMEAAARTVPGNPHYDGHNLPWEYIYFGSYPQQEVDSPTSAIINANYNEFGDAWIDGVKYHRLNEWEVTNDSNFGNKTYRYFRWSRIKWQVLRNEGDTLLIQAYTALDCQPYNKSSGAITWSKCSLRNWLNTEFYNTAFSSRERKDIVESSVDNSMYGEPKTIDNIYILSQDEVEDSSYGYGARINEQTGLRRYPPTDYAYYMGADMQDGDGVYADGFCWWWLRGPGNGTNTCASMVDPHGSATWYVGVSNKTNTIVPVLRIKTTSAYWDNNDDGTSGDGGETLAQTISYKTDKISEDGKIVYGTKAFSLKASTDGDGKLTYKSSNKSVVTVGAAGKVTVKGYGTATITITAAATKSYQKGTLKIKVTVVPKKVVIKKGYQKSGKTIFEWDDDKTVTGYQYCYADNKKFEDATTKKTSSRTKVEFSSRDEAIYVRVRAYKKVGDKTYYGEWSKTWSAK